MDDEIVLGRMLKKPAEKRVQTNRTVIVGALDNSSATIVSFFLLTITCITVVLLLFSLFLRWPAHPNSKPIATAEAEGCTRPAVAADPQITAAVQPKTKTVSLEKKGTSPVAPAVEQPPHGKLMVATSAGVSAGTIGIAPLAVNPAASKRAEAGGAATASGAGIASPPFESGAATVAASASTRKSDPDKRQTRDVPDSTTIATAGPSPSVQTAPSGPLSPANAATSKLPDKPHLSSTEIAALSARGDSLLGANDIVSARLFYERAADAGDARAALRLGATFDPTFLAHAAFPGAHSDVKRALFWYSRARELGATDAVLWIKGLKLEAGHR